MSFGARLALASLTVLLCAAPRVGTAHIALMAPEARGTDQKNGPCGRVNGTRSANVSTFAAGETIMVMWRETVPHPGHYRISFDEDGHDSFQDPTSYEDRYTNAAVLLDGIMDNTGTGVYAVEVTLPNVECTSCTLQLVQVMTDKAPYVVGTNDLYYQCADLILAAPVDSGDAGIAEIDAGAEASDAGVVDDAGVAGETDSLASGGCACMVVDHRMSSVAILLGLLALALARVNALFSWSLSSCSPFLRRASQGRVRANVRRRG